MIPHYNMGPDLSPGQNQQYPPSTTLLCSCSMKTPMHVQSDKRNAILNANSNVIYEFQYGDLDCEY